MFITKLLFTVTGTPNGLTAVRSACKLVQLSWSAPASNTPPVAGYEVFYAESGSGSIESAGTTTNTIVTVVVPKLEVMYDFFVVAYSDAPNALPSARSNNSTIDMGEFKSFNSK